MNRKFGKLNGNEIEFAPDIIRVDGHDAISPSAEQYLAAGWYKVNDVVPSVSDGSYATPMGWVINGDSICRMYEIITPAPVPRVFSKLKCWAALRSAGLWDSVQSYLEQSGLWTAFLLAQDVSEDNEQFKEGLAAMKSELGITDEQAEAILSNCVAEA